MLIVLRIVNILAREVRRVLGADLRRSSLHYARQPDLGLVHQVDSPPVLFVPTIERNMFASARAGQNVTIGPVSACYSVRWPPSHFTSTNSKIMSPSLSNPTEFPIEILEQILLLLPSQDIIKTQSVPRVPVNSRQVTVLTLCCTI